MQTLTHIELVKKMEEAAEKETGIPLRFSFEYASDGNLDLYALPYEFSYGDIQTLVKKDWVPEEILEEYEIDLDPFEWDADYLSQSHHLFQFMLEKTFGAHAKVAGVIPGDREDPVILNIASST